MALRGGEVADDADLRMAGQRSGPARPRRGPARSVAAPVPCASCCPSGEAATPAAQMTQRRLRCDAASPPVGGCTSQAVGVDRRSRARPVRTSTPSFSSCSRALRAERLGHGLQHARAAFDQQDARAGAGRCGGTRRAACGARSRPACRPSPRRSGRPPITTKVSHARARVGVGLLLGRLEGQQHAAADLEGVGQRLQAGRERRPVVVAEVAVGGAGGDDQVVVGQRARRRPDALRARRIDARPPRRAAWSRWRCLRNRWRTGAAMAGAARPAVATWYSSGWNRWWLVRSTSVMSTGRLRRARAASRPPKPQPMMRTLRPGRRLRHPARITEQLSRAAGA